MPAGPRALGIEVAVGGNWTAKAEYDYIDLARRTYDLTDVGLPRVNVDPNIHLFKLGLNYRLWDDPAWDAPVAGRTTGAARAGQLECPRPDHVHRASLSALPLAL